MRLFIDECLSPLFAIWLNATGEHDAVHPLHIGRRGDGDYRVVARCLAEDRVIVTENGDDFRRLVARSNIHPGLIILPCLGRKETWDLLQAALAYLGARGNPMDVMVNKVLEVGTSGAIALAPLPEG